MDWQSLRGRIGVSPEWGSSWIDLTAPADFKPGDRIRLTLGGGATKVIVRLLPEGYSPDQPVGIVGGPLEVPRSKTVELVLQEDHASVIQISVHGGPNPWGCFPLGNNGPAMLLSAACHAPVLPGVADRAPDLRLVIRRSFEAGSAKLILQLWVEDPTLGLRFEEFDPVPLVIDIGGFQQSLKYALEALAGLAAKGPEEVAIAERRLESIGVTLFRQLPEKLQERLLSLHGKAETLQILSDEPAVPWELLKLQRSGPAGRQNGPFLCEAFAMTRWLLKATEILEIPVRRLALVVPRHSRLPASEDEKQDMRALAGGGREVVEIAPTYMQVLAGLRSGEYDSWHFCGHGTAYEADPNRMTFELEGEQPLRPEDLPAHGESLGRQRSLVFLNGCETGIGGFSLMGLGGWAKQLLAAGAGAFVGTLWPVRDQKARAFARAFYRHFLSGKPIGEAVRQARLAVRALFPGDPSWLAYTVFAHPLAVCPPGATQERKE